MALIVEKAVNDHSTHIATTYVGGRRHRLRDLRVVTKAQDQYNFIRLYSARQAEITV